MLIIEPLVDAASGRRSWGVVEVDPDDVGRSRRVVAEYETLSIASRLWPEAVLPDF